MWHKEIWGQVNKQLWLFFFIWFDIYFHESIIESKHITRTLSLFFFKRSQMQVTIGLSLWETQIHTICFCKGSITLCDFFWLMQQWQHHKLLHRTLQAKTNRSRRVLYDPFFAIRRIAVTIRKNRTVWTSPKGRTKQEKWPLCTNLDFWDTNKYINLCGTDR